jgi:hypothetical protein
MVSDVSCEITEKIRSASETISASKIKAGMWIHWARNYYKDQLTTGILCNKPRHYGMQFLHFESFRDHN